MTAVHAFTGRFQSSVRKSFIKIHFWELEMSVISFLQRLIAPYVKNWCLKIFPLNAIVYMTAEFKMLSEIHFFEIQFWNLAHFINRDNKFITFFHEHWRFIQWEFAVVVYCKTFWYSVGSVLMRRSLINLSVELKMWEEISLFSFTVFDKDRVMDLTIWTMLKFTKVSSHLKLQSRSTYGWFLINFQSFQI